MSATSISAVVSRRCWSSRGDATLTSDARGRIAIRGPEERWSVGLVAQNLTNKDFCTGIFTQPNGAAFGLNIPTTGATALRCTLNEPRQVSLELNAKF